MRREGVERRLEMMEGGSRALHLGANDFWVVGERRISLLVLVFLLKIIHQRVTVSRMMDMRRFDWAHIYWEIDQCHSQFCLWETLRLNTDDTVWVASFSRVVHDGALKIKWKTECCNLAQGKEGGFNAENYNQLYKKVWILWLKDKFLLLSCLMYFS